MLANKYIFWDVMQNMIVLGGA